VVGIEEIGEVSAQAVWLSQSYRRTVASLIVRFMRSA